MPDIRLWDVKNDREFFYDLYWVKRKSSERIAKTLLVTGGQVRRTMRRLNIPIRPNKPQGELLWIRKAKVMLKIARKLNRGAQLSQREVSALAQTSRD